MYVWLLGLDTSGPNEVVKECQNLIITKSHTLLKEGLDVKTRIWEGVICTKLSIFNHTYISSTRWITNIRLTLYKTYHYMSKDIFRTPLQKQMPLLTKFVALWTKLMPKEAKFWPKILIYELIFFVQIATFWTILFRVCTNHLNQFTYVTHVRW